MVEAAVGETEIEGKEIDKVEQQGAESNDDDDNRPLAENSGPPELQGTDRGRDGTSESGRNSGSQEDGTEPELSEGRGEVRVGARLEAESNQGEVSEGAPSRSVDGGRSEGDLSEDVREGSLRSERRVEPEPAATKKNIRANYQLTEEDKPPTQRKDRAYGNIEAIAALFREEDNDTVTADPDNLKAIAQFSGWGALPIVFEDRKKAPQWVGWVKNQLKELLTKDEIKDASRSTINAHFTSQEVIKSIWKGLKQLGVTTGNALEPGAGIGNWLGMMPKNMGLDLTMIERDPISARIARILYPQAKVLNGDLTNIKFAENAYDLVVGNVPFSQTKHRYSGLGTTKNHALHNFVIIKSFMPLS